ncbi:MAG: hypothetical protein MRZ79_15000 [Bacteroidia bacterium]|nr:hypothetical protein [Bacteroidia bacterium]
MVRLLSYVPGAVVIALLVLIPVLRLPSLQGALFTPEESHYMVLVQRMVDGNTLYQDAWHAGTPFLVWVYYFFYIIFGKYSLLMIHIFTCIYIWITAIFLNGLIGQYKPFQKLPGLPAIIFVFLTCLPWHSQELNTSLAIILPSLVAVWSILELGDRRRINYRLMLRAGFLMGLIILIAYKGIFISLAILLTYLIVGKGNLDELFAFVGGLSISIFLGLILLFVNGNLDDFFEIGVLYYIDRARLDIGEGYDYHVVEQIQSWFFTHGLLMLFLIFGWIHYRLKFFSYVAKIRTLEVSMSVWLFATIFLLASKWNQLQIDDFILLAVPASFYCSRIMEFKWLYRFRLFVFILLFAWPLYQYRYYFSHKIETLATEPISTVWTTYNWLELSESLPIKEYLKNDSVEGGIWIMDYQPALYTWLGYPCPNKYTDFRISAYKIPVLSKGQEEKLISKLETDRSFFLQFQSSPPGLILDPRDQFVSLKDRYPSIGEKYERVDLGNYPIYRRKNITLKHEIRSNYISR